MIAGPHVVEMWMAALWATWVERGQVLAMNERMTESAELARLMGLVVGLVTDGDQVAFAKSVLTPKQWQVWSMREVQDMTWLAISHMLGISTAAARDSHRASQRRIGKEMARVTNHVGNAAGQARAGTARDGRAGPEGCGSNDAQA